jgi:hypothetical protein
MKVGVSGGCQWSPDGRNAGQEMIYDEKKDPQYKF